MTRTIRSLNKGRARVWWVHHGREAKRAAQLVALVGLWILASTLDYRDQVQAERASRAELEREAREAGASAQGFSRRLPRITFVLEARTPEELELRLAEIAGKADGLRAELRGGRP